MSLTRLHRRHPLNPVNVEARSKRFRRTGITVRRGVTPAGKHYCHDGDNVPASLPYACAVKPKKPYRGKSDRMRSGDDRTWTIVTGNSNRGLDLGERDDPERP